MPSHSIRLIASFRHAADVGMVIAIIVKIITSSIMVLFIHAIDCFTV